MQNTKTLKTVTLITGILMAILGVYTFFTPLRTFLSIGWFLGALFLLNGIELVIISLSAEKKEIGACILGILEAFAGFALLFGAFQRLLTDMLIAYFAGGFLLLYGIFQIVKGLGEFKTSKSSALLAIIFGALSVILGFFSLAHPVFTMISVGYIIAFSILMQGINMILLALHLGKTD